ncbi:hypothetical protein RZS08_18100, partial [Arthrospira platensis SPKY1]|nr:hypothetical protein [Arthrospira platensis SPKY1]
REWFGKILDEWEQTHEQHDVLLSLMDAAAFFFEQKEAQAIQQCLRIFSAICKKTGNNEALGCLAFGLGLNAVLNGQHATALEHLADARKYLEPLHIPYQLILTDLETGKCLILENEVEKARNLLQDLLLRTKKMGLAPLSSEITSLL